MENENIRVMISILLGYSGLFWTVRKLYQIYVLRNNNRILSITKDRDGHLNVFSRGLTENELMELVRQMSQSETDNVIDRARTRT